MPQAWTWDVPRPAIALRYMVEAADEHGITPAVVLDGTGLRWPEFRSDGLIDVATELAVVRNLLRAAPDPAPIAITISKKYTLGNADIPGLAVLTSPTIGAAMEVVQHFFALTPAFVRLEVESDVEFTGLVVHDDHIPADVRQFVVARDLAFGLRGIRLVARADFWIPGMRIDINLDDDYLAAMQPVLPPLPIERCGHCALIGPSWLAEQPLPQSDSATARSLERQCQDLLVQRTAHRGLSGQVRSILSATPTAMPSMPQVAAQLLESEQTTYRGLIDEVREALATELLSAGLTVEQVAMRLGYAETASFSRAFKRWVGTPPIKFRRR